MTNVTLSLPPDLAQALPSDPESLAQVVTLGLKQWQAHQATRVDLSKIESLYNLRQPDEIQNFLTEFPLLRQVLETAHPTLQNFFGPDIQLDLALVHDPEVENWRTLVVYILTSLPVDDVLNHLARFDEAWLVHQPDVVQEQLSFNPEFV